MEKAFDVTDIYWALGGILVTAFGTLLCLIDNVMSLVDKLLCQ
jgi:hypothetical protein